jgi:hypothetical protein
MVQGSANKAHPAFWNDFKRDGIKNVRNTKMLRQMYRKTMAACAPAPALSMVACVVFQAQENGYQGAGLHHPSGFLIAEQPESSSYRMWQ